MKIYPQIGEKRHGAKYKDPETDTLVRTKPDPRPGLDTVSPEKWTASHASWLSNQNKLEPPSFQPEEKIVVEPYQTIGSNFLREQTEVPLAQWVDDLPTQPKETFAESFYKDLDTGSNFDKQVGGDHYKGTKHQPLQVCLDRHGYQAFRGACLCKIDKYLARSKDDRLEDYRKAQHVLNLLIEVTEGEDL